LNKFITIENQYLKVIISTLGAGIYQIYLKSDHEVPVLITNSNPEDFLTSTNYYGKTIGRISGRLFGPTYTLNQQNYPVECNPKNPFMLHGGKDGLWVQPFEVDIQKADEVVLFYVEAASATFPGELGVTVVYRLIEKTLHIEFKATSTEDTLCNLTNHVYFNLNIASGDVLDHHLSLNSTKYNVLDDQYRFIKQADVKHTPFDFLEPKPLRNGVLALSHTAQKGLDHCFIKAEGPWVGTLYEPSSKRRLNVYSDYPSVVIYTHNFSSGKPLNTLTPQGIHSSITFECQYEPDGIHHKVLNAAILKKNEPYHHYIDFEFDF
jgi:aldose 1-epimerase